MKLFYTKAIITLLLAANSISLWASEAEIWRDTVNYNDIVYQEQDLNEFYILIESIKTLSVDASNADSIKSEMDRLLDIFAEISGAMLFANIEVNKDVTNSYFAKEFSKNQALLGEARNAVIYTFGYLSYTPCSFIVNEFFLGIFPNGDIPTIVSDEALSDSAMYYKSKELELQTSYYAALATGFPVEVNGQMMTVDEILSSNLTDSLRLEAYTDYKIHKNEVLGNLLLELAKARSNKARHTNYENYLALRYAELNRTYLPSEVNKTNTYVKKYLTPYLQKVDSTYEANKNNIETIEGGADNLLSILSEVLEQDFDEMQCALDYMKKYEMYDIGSGENRTTLSFCDNFNQYNSPFMIISSQWYQDKGLSTLIHEFGHYYSSYTNSKERNLIFERNHDLEEICSQGFELLTANVLSKTLSEDEALAELSIIMRSMLLGGLINGCIVNAFEQELYNNPNMSLDELNELFISTSNSFLEGDSSLAYHDRYNWVSINHLFVVPLYYISYTMSALPSLELWAIARQDKELAKQKYYALLEKGAFGDYSTTLESAGLNTAFDEELYKNVSAALDDFLNLETTSLKNTEAQTGITAYPNPVSDHFIINTSNSTIQGSKSYRLYDTKGALLKKGILNQIENNIDMEKYSAGIYMLTLENEDQTIEHITIIKQ